MEQLPYPQEPTAEEIIAEEKCIHAILFSSVPVHLAFLMLAVILIALAISYNFNVMWWLE